MPKDKMILSSIDFDDLISSIKAVVREELAAQRQTEVPEKFLSIAEACKMFTPAISRQTLASWSAAGHLQKRMIGAKPFYKMSEVLEAGKTLKRYKVPSSTKK